MSTNKSELKELLTVDGISNTSENTAGSLTFKVLDSSEIIKDSKSPVKTTEPQITETPKEKKEPSITQDSKTPEKAKNNFEKMLFTQKQLIDVKKFLVKIIEAIGENPSFLNRLSKYWGDKPTSYKVIAGVALVGPTALIGIIAHAIPLLAISGLTLAGYVTSSVVLDDHNTHNVSVTERLKEGVLSLADVLGIVIEALDTIRKDLAIEVEKFKEENEKYMEENNKLSLSLQDLSRQLQHLSYFTECLQVTELMLRKEKDELTMTAKSLESSIESQSKLFEENQKKLEEVTRQHEQILIQLSGTSSELETVKKEMGKELEKTRMVAKIMSEAAQSLSGTVVEDKENRIIYQEKLDKFLMDKEKSFDQVTNRICEAEKKLSMVEKELELSNNRYTLLLKKHEKQLQQHSEQQKKQDEQLDRLQNISNQLTTKIDSESKSKIVNSTEVLRTQGIFTNRLKVNQEENINLRVVQVQ